jgi:hypothetical protein
MTFDNSTELEERLYNLQQRHYQIESLAADLAIELQECRKVMFNATTLDEVKKYLADKKLIQNQ